VGVGGYWYAVQLRALLATGHLAEPTLPAALWFLAVRQAGIALAALAGSLAALVWAVDRPGRGREGRPAEVGR
jgi:hypothetical protein